MRDALMATSSSGPVNNNVSFKGSQKSTLKPRRVSPTDTLSHGERVGSSARRVAVFWVDLLHPLKVVHELHTISAPTQLKTLHNGTKVRAFRAGCFDMLFVRNDRLLIKKEAKIMASPLNI